MFRENPQPVHETLLAFVFLIAGVCKQLLESTEIRMPANHIVPAGTGGIILTVMSITDHVLHM